ncbi:MAG TPA: hypothetical protein DCS93_08565 [Microscillaceae bacterium]|nr:hypothetical protein [Microscillaceae bacterium]
MNKQILNLSFLSILLALFAFTQISGFTNAVAKSKSVKNNKQSIQKINTNSTSLQANRHCK